MADQSTPAQGQPAEAPSAPAQGQRRITPPSPPQQGTVRVPTGPIGGQGEMAGQAAPTTPAPAPAPQPAVQPAAPATQPPAQTQQGQPETQGQAPTTGGLPDNWLDDPQFREYSGKQQEQLRQARQFATDERDKRLALESRMETLETAGLDDFGLMQHNSTKLESENSTLRQQLQNRDAIDQLYNQKLADTQQLSDAYGVDQGQLMKFTTLQEAETHARNAWMERTRQELSTGQAPVVDMGGGIGSGSGLSSHESAIRAAQESGNVMEYRRLAIWGEDGPQVRGKRE